MKYLFRAHTAEGYTLKILTELLNNFYQTVNLEITPKGIYIIEADSNMRILVDIFLDSLNFSNYKCAETQIVPIKCNDLYQAFKPVRKRDPITLFISEEDPTSLGIICIPPNEQSRKSTTNLKIIRERRSKPEIDVEYTISPINVVGKSFTRMCKDLTRSNRIICVKRKGGYIVFSNSDDDLIKKMNEFDTRDTLDDEPEDETTFDQDFEAGHITKLGKVANSDKMAHIYAQESLPLHISLDLGNIGKIGIFITSIQQYEKKTRKDSDSESDYEEEYSSSDEESD